MRVLVTGGRRYNDWGTLCATLLPIHIEHPISAIIHGDATGADALAKKFALLYGIRNWPFPASWSDISHPMAVVRTRRDGSQYDANAGPRRNQRMITEGLPDLVVAFPGGDGTADMVARSKKAGVPVLVVA